MNDKPPHSPTSFLHGPSLHPQPQQARVVEVRPVPVRAILPCLTVSLSKRVYVRKELQAALHLRDGQPLELHAPERRGDPWLLDTRPRVGRPFRVDMQWGGGRFTRTCHVGTEQLRPGRNQTRATVPATLRLALGAEYLPTADSPRGIFVLTPVA